jgi:hypothetical protein
LKELLGGLREREGVVGVGWERKELALDEISSK